MSGEATRGRDFSFAESGISSGLLCGSSFFQLLALQEEGGVPPQRFCQEQQPPDLRGPFTTSANEGERCDRSASQVWRFSDVR